MEKKYLTPKIGERQGSLQVCALSTDAHSNRYVTLRCECGREIRRAIRDYHRLSGRACRACSLRSLKKTHGHSGGHGRRTLEYKSWGNMCGWGRKGGDVDIVWMKSFEKFLEDMGNRPSPDHRLTRKDRKIGFYKKNTIWKKRSE